LEAKAKELLGNIEIHDTGKYLIHSRPWNLLKAKRKRFLRESISKELRKKASF